MFNHIATFESQISNEEKMRIRKEVRDLSVLKPWKAYSYILLDWVIIFSTIAVAIKIANPFFTVLALVVIGSRQHALLLIMHDAAHMRLSNNRKINQVIADLLLAFPHFVTTAKYKDTHLAHHRHLNTDLDPDWQLKKSNSDWDFPKTRRAVWWLLLRQLIGLNTAYTIITIYRFAAAKSETGAVSETTVSFKLLRLCYYILAAAMISYLHVWGLFLLYWVLPVFTVLPFIFRIRSIAEHFGLAWSHELNSTRNVELNFFESFFIVPHSANYHLAHHLYPSVPFYNLKKLQTVLMQSEVYAAKAVNAEGYLLPNKNSVLNSVSTS